MVDESTKSEGLRKYDSWFQLAFRLEEVWELHHKIFNMWERKEVKGKRTKKAKVDPQVEIKSKTRKSDLIIEELPERHEVTSLAVAARNQIGKVAYICTFASGRQII